MSKSKEMWSSLGEVLKVCQVRKFYKSLILNYCRSFKLSYFNSKGFTLLEVLAVIVIMGIIASIAVPSVFATIDKAKEDVCHINTSDIEKRYGYHLLFEDKEHSDEVFYQYLLQYGGDLCPIDGIISYKDGEVQCSLHPKGEVSDDGDNDEGVPYL